MKKLDAYEIINKYEESSEKIFEEAMYGKGNARIINREYKKQHKLYDQFKTDEELCDKCIELLWNSDNICSRVNAAMYYLALRKNIEASIEMLNEISELRNTGGIAMNAYSILDIWNEKGKIEL